MSGVLLYDNPVSGNCYTLNVPTVVLEDGRHLAESNAILWYFADGTRYLHVAPEGGFDLEPYTAVRAWLDRVAAGPGMVPITA